MEKYKVFDCGQYKIHTIKIDRFKSFTVDIRFTRKITKETLTKRALLGDILRFSTKNYPNKRDIAKSLENLYSSDINISSYRTGSNYITKFSTEYLLPKYCEPGIIKEYLNMLFEFIFNPNIKDNLFDETSFEVVKNRLKKELESIKDNGSRYAFRRCLELVDNNSIISYFINGYLEDIDNITREDLVKEYNDLINNSNIDVYIVGNIDMEEIVNIFKERFIINNNETKYPLYNYLTDIKELDITESGHYEQDEFIMFYNIPNMTEKERRYVLPILNFILGGGGLTSKLYKYLREENSLCYSVGSRVNRNDNYLVISAGIDSKNKKLCVKLVKKAINEMIEGNFTNDNLLNAKKYVKSYLKMTHDDIFSILEDYYIHNTEDIPLSFDRLKYYEEITKEDIINLAKKLNLLLTYLLIGE